MKKTARVILLCLIAIAQVGMFAFAWRGHQQTNEMLWTLRMDYKALVLRADGIIIDYGLDSPLFVPVVLIFSVCLLLTTVLLADEIRRANG